MADNSQNLLERFQTLEALITKQSEKIELQGDEIKCLKESLLHEKQERSIIFRDLTQLREENNQHMTTITAQNERIEEQNERIEEQNERIEEQNERIEEQNERIEEQNGTITNQNEEIIRLTSENKDIVEKLATYEAILEVKETELEDLKDELEEKFEKYKALAEENGRLGAIVDVYKRIEKEEEERYKSSLIYKIKMWWQDLFKSDDKKSKEKDVELKKSQPTKCQGNQQPSNAG